MDNYEINNGIFTISINEARRLQRRDPKALARAQKALANNKSEIKRDFSNFKNSSGMYLSKEINTDYSDFDPAKQKFDRRGDPILKELKVLYITAKALNFLVKGTMKSKVLLDRVLQAGVEKPLQIQKNRMKNKTMGALLKARKTNPEEVKDVDFSNGYKLSKAANDKVEDDWKKGFAKKENVYNIELTAVESLLDEVGIKMEKRFNLYSDEPYFTVVLSFKDNLSYDEFLERKPKVVKQFKSYIKKYAKSLDADSFIVSSEKDNTFKSKKIYMNYSFEDERTHINKPIKYVKRTETVRKNAGEDTNAGDFSVSTYFGY